MDHPNEPPQTLFLLDGVRDGQPSPLNRAFLYGDAAFEVLRSRTDGTLVLYEPHLARLKRSSGLLEIPWENGAFESDLRELPRAPCRVRLMLFGDAESLGGRSTRSHRVLIAQPLTSSRPGTHAITREGRPTVLPGSKVASYAVSAYFARLAATESVHEVLLLDGQTLLEGATSNVVLVRAGSLLTPHDEGILPGVTRDHVLGLARDAGLSCERRCISQDELQSADECFITSAIRGVHPITRIDGVPVGSGEPGPLTNRLADLYSETVRLD